MYREREREREIEREIKRERERVITRRPAHNSRPRHWRDHRAH